MITREPTWTLWGPKLQEALDSGRDPTTLETIQQEILSERAQFWSWDNAAMVTTVQDDALTGRRKCHLWLAAGTLEALESHLPEVERFATGSGAVDMTISGRFGWMRSFLTKRAGYHPVAVQYHKELDHG